MMLGFLLARAGVDVVVLEKHADFFRDFRGDTIHPSTLELMYELGLLDDFLKLPHQKIEHLTAQIGDQRMRMVDLTHLPTRCKYIALMPQWDFLNFLAEHGKRYKTFDLRMRAEATGSDRGGRARHRPSRANAGWRTCDPRRSRRRRRWPAFDGARERPARERRFWRADGRAVVPAAAEGDRRDRDVRTHRSRHDDDHARPRRLLAVRLRDPEGRHRARQGGRARWLPQRLWRCRHSSPTASPHCKAGTTSSF
jgi:2-polyprenyl-6-methoxyphenol hydroxylase-like FAD-dependent oxidoreductase